MSQRTFQLPLRTIARTRREGGNAAQWICRRCLATQAEQPPKPNSIPLNVDQTPPKRTLKPASEAENYNPKLPSSQRDYSLTKTDHYLKRPLPQVIPHQYLQHSTTDLLPPAEREQRDNVEPHKLIIGVVVRAGKMDKTVTVRIPRMQWNNKVKKNFHIYDKHLVHDPNNSLVAGDVISLHRLRASSAVHHVVGSIVAPFGKPIEDRPHIPTADERLAAYKEQRFAKFRRRGLRRRAADGDEEAINTLVEMGLDPGVGVGPGVGKTENLEKGVGEKRTPTKGAILGNKGQKLPHGILPGGKTEVGDIGKRAAKNKERTRNYQAQAEDNIMEAKEKAEDLAKRGIATDTKLPFQNPVINPPEGKVKKPRGI